jgi:hypothetical protein
MLAGEAAAGAGGSSLVLPAFGGTAAAGGANLGMLAGEAAGSGAAAGGLGEVALNGGGGTYALAGGAGADTLGAGAGGAAAGGLPSFLAGPGGAAAALALPFIAGPALQKGIDAVFGDGQYSPAQAQENREEQAQGLSRILNGAPVQRTTVPNPAMYSMSPERFAESGQPEMIEIIVEPVTGAQFTPQQIQQAMAAMGSRGLENMPRMVR